MSFNKLILLVAALNTSAFSQQATVLLDNNSLFPSNAYTTQAPTETGLRVALPDSENVCTASSPVCSNQKYLNGLDGFSVNPRVSVCFSGPIDPSSTEGRVWFRPVDVSGADIRLNQGIYDPSTNCIFGKPDRVLLQKTSYLLLVNSGIRDTAGNLVGSSPLSQQCQGGGNKYCKSFRSAVSKTGSDDVLAASLFTTMTVTSWIQRAFRYVDQNEIGLILPAGLPSVYSVPWLRSITWNPGTSNQTPQAIPLDTALADVGGVAFGYYLSPNFLNTSGPDAGLITTSGDQPVAVPQLLGGLTFGYVPVSYHVFLPKTAPPPGGYPVVIYGHGLGDSQFGAPSYIASTFARSGFATVAMEIMGHGYGSDSTVTLVDKLGLRYTVQTPGRGIQLSPGAKIGPSDGCILPGPFAVRDCGRQTAVDVYALVKTIQRSGGLGLGLNAGKISYVGQSFGSIYGTLVQSVARDIDAAVLNGGGGPFVDVARLALNGRPLGVQYLAGLNLLNVNGGPNSAPSEDYFHDSFNDNYVYRDQPVVTNTVNGAMQIQAAFEAAEWLGMLGDAAAFAPYLQTAPLPGNNARLPWLQFGSGDLEVPNPANVTFLKAAGAENESTFLDFSGVGLAPAGNGIPLAAVSDPAYLPGFPILPHRILSNPTIFSLPGELPLALAEQQSATSFFLNGGQQIPDANLFLTGPYQGQTVFKPGNQLPSGLNFSIVIPR